MESFSMEIITILWGFMGLLALLLRGRCLVGKRRFLQGKIEYLRARMQDIRNICFTRIQRGKKRKLDTDQLDWMDEAEELVKKADFLLGQRVGGWRSFLISVKTWDVDKLVDALQVHTNKGDVLFRQAMANARGSNHGYYLPVKALVGQVASITLKQLELLLQDDSVGRIAIHGVRGVGKTFLMKHLHNSATKLVEKFDNVLWVSLIDQFTIKHVQDAVAAVVNCDFTGVADMNARAIELSDTLTGLASFALFLDGVPATDFSLDQVGNPGNAEGRRCKLIVTTSSTLECRLLDHFEAVKIDPLPKVEAHQLFMREANIRKEFVSSLDGISNSLADRCCGLPRMIVDVATSLCGIDDHREWRNALFELRRYGMENLPLEVVNFNSPTQV